MTQLAEKFSLRHIMIVCLAILIFGTASTIALVPAAKPVREKFQAYTMSTLNFTSALGGTIGLAPIVRSGAKIVQKALKQRI